MKVTKTRCEKGFAIVLTTLALTSTMLVAGLGFDVATLYLVRTKLQGAMDAASLAAVRALTQNPDTTAAKTVGTEFLTANFPTSYWGAQSLASMPLANAVSISLIDKNGNPGTAGTTATAKMVTVTAGVTAPLYFLRILGQQTATISFTAQAKRQGILLMLVLDGSGSMQNLIAGTPACTWAKNDAHAFLGYSQFDPDIDRIGLVTFGGNTYTVAPISDFQSPAGTVNTSSSVYTALNGFACNGNTNTVEGLQATYTAIQTFWGGASPSRANVIVLMTDGAPNGFTADWSTQIKGGSLCGPPAPGGHLTGYMARQTPTEEGIYNVTPNSSGTGAAMPGAGTLGVIPDNGNCAFEKTGPTTWYQDFTLVPPTDVYGDAMYGTGTYIPGASSVVPSSSTNSLPATEQQFRDLSSNAADGAATRIRSDSTLRPTIYTIALAGNSGANIYDVLDATLLQRMANVPGSAIYNPHQPVGAYFYAQNATNLSGEFSAAASAIVARMFK